MQGSQIINKLVAGEKAAKEEDQRYSSVSHYGAQGEEGREKVRENGQQLFPPLLLLVMQVKGRKEGGKAELLPASVMRRGCCCCCCGVGRGREGGAGGGCGGDGSKILKCTNGK